MMTFTSKVRRALFQAMASSGPRPRNPDTRRAPELLQDLRELHLLLNESYTEQERPVYDTLNNYLHHVIRAKSEEGNPETIAQIRTELIGLTALN